VTKIRFRIIVGLSLFIVLAGVAIAGVVYRLFFVRLVRVPQGAMMNTILLGDCLTVHRLFGDVKRGSVVVFEYPGDSDRYIARVVGLPGETIQIRGRSVYINGSELPERRVQTKPEDFSDAFDKLEEISSDGDGPYEVFFTSDPEDPTAQQPPDEMKFATSSPLSIREGQYFLLGDNRDNSVDSRYRGTVPRELIWGTAFVIYWSSFEDKATHEERVRSERLFKKIK